MKQLNPKLESMIRDEMEKYAYLFELIPSFSKEADFIAKIEKPQVHGTHGIFSTSSKKQLIMVVNVISIVERLNGEETRRLLIEKVKA